MLSVAGYAASRAYERLRGVLGAVRVLVRERGGWSCTMLDSNSAFDRGLARRARLGWIGRHSLLLVPGWGGAVVIGALASSVVLDVRRGRVPRGDPCEGTPIPDPVVTRVTVGDQRPTFSRTRRG
jgi:epoxyqueuosine reductase QueG